MTPPETPPRKMNHIVAAADQLKKTKRALKDSPQQQQGQAPTKAKQQGDNSDAFSSVGFKKDRKDSEDTKREISDL